MSAGTVLIIVLVAAVIAVIVGTKCNVNMGLIAFVLAAIICGFILGIKPRQFYTWWPTNIMIQIIGVTFFFGYVSETGAIQAIASRMLYVVRNKMALIPFVFLVLPGVLGFVGVNPMGINALCLPIVASICMYTNLSPLFLFFCYGCGSTIGLVSPLGSAGIVAGGMLTGAVGPEIAGAIMPRVYLNNVIFGLVCFVIIYLIFRGWRLKIGSEYLADFMKKPAPVTRDQKITLILMLIAILIFIIPGIFGITLLNNALDVGWVYLLAGVVCALFKLADLRKVISTRIPWGIILLVGGFTILLSIVSNSGGVELIGNYVSNNVSNNVIAPVAGLLGGITGLFSDSIGVVFPIFIPIGAGIMSAGVAVAPTALFSSIIIGTLCTGCAPFSTGGAMLLSFAPEKLSKKLFWGCLIVAAFNVVVSTLLCVVGIYG